MPPIDRLTDSLIRNAKAGQRPVQKAESEKQTSGARKGPRSADTIDKRNPPEKKFYRLWGGGGLYLEVDPGGANGGDGNTGSGERKSVSHQEFVEKRFWRVET